MNKQQELLKSANFIDDDMIKVCVSRAKNISGDYNSGIAGCIYQKDMHQIILMTASGGNVNFVEITNNQINFEQSTSINLNDISNLKIKNGFLLIEKSLVITFVDKTQLVVNCNFTQFKSLKAFMAKVAK